MKSSSLILLSSFAFIILSSSSLWTVASSDKHQDFLECLLHHSPNSYSITKVVYTPINSSYSSVLNFSIPNLRFSTPKTPKPLVIITPTNISHIQAAVICSKSHDLQIRIRSGGHDFEGLSSVAYLPFIIVDLINLRSITVDVENSTAWVQSGATLGELYYRIAEKSRTLAFPAGVCPTVGVGGHFSGGGYGMLIRKYGLAADNVIDAYLVDANGKFHDRESMGEDLFWAIRGGGGGSFGIVVAWKVKLVPVPPTVTICLTTRTEKEDTIKLIHRWQFVADKMDENLYMSIFLNGGTNFALNSSEGGKINPVIEFNTLFLGEADELVAILKTTFPELGLTKEDCRETSWIESALIAWYGFQTEEVLESLLNRSTLSAGSKMKSDFVKEPITEAAIEGIWQRLKSQHEEFARLIFIPYGGRMSQISETETPYPHRAGNLYKIGYGVAWQEQSADTEKRHLKWIREIYSYLTPFVSKSPRASYVNYRDLDIGSNDKNGKTSYEQARVWGFKYFGDNFNRLVKVKTEVDYDNFFRHEQSIPTMTPA